jgi:alpha-L-fucosidase 2
MLLQSQAGEVSLLPALPESWPEGAVRGLCARGGFVVSMEWEKGRLRSVEIRSRLGGPCVLRSRTADIAEVRLNSKAVALTRDPGGVVSFSTRPGGVYRVTPEG